MKSSVSQVWIPSISSTSSPGNTTKLLIDDSCGIQRGDSGYVIEWRHFNDIAAHDVQVSDFPEDTQELQGREAPCHRRPRSGRKSRIEAINIDCEITRPVTDAAANAITDLLDGKIITGDIVENGHAKRIIHPGPYTDLNGSACVYDAFSHGFPEHRAMIEEQSVLDRTDIYPRIGMRVELDKRQFAMMLRGSTQQGKCDEMVATQSNKGRSRFDDSHCRGFNARRNREGIGMPEIDITEIDGLHMIERIKAAGIGRKHVPGRLGVARSNGIPRNATSAPSTVDSRLRLVPGRFVVGDALYRTGEIALGGKALNVGDNPLEGGKIAKAH